MMKPLAAIGAALLAIALLPQAAVAAPSAPRTYVVALKDGAATPSTAADSLARRYGGTTVAAFNTLGAYSARLDSAQAAALSRDASVAFVVPNRVIRSSEPRQVSVNCRSAAEPAQCLPENVKRIGGAVSSQHSGDEQGAVSGVRIAVMDSGVDRTDIDLNVVGGVGCLSGRPLQDGSAFDDQDGHGTEVAGVAAGVDDDQGIVGVAPAAPVFSIQVLDGEGGGTLESLLCGVNYVTGTLTDKDTSNDLGLVNMSISGTVDDVGTATADDGACGLRNHDPLHLAICRSIARGAVYSVAAGNDAVDISTRVPAGYREVISSTAITDLDGIPGGKGGTDCFGVDLGAPIADDTPVFFSNYATSKVDRLHTVAAVGSCVITTYPHYYAVLDFGTSFAAPATTGVIALCMSTGACPRRAPAATIVRILTQTAAYNLAHRSYGYTGDPLHSRAGAPYYGFLVSAALY